tara:strand:+ start:202 stop:390 length:189 start_codon:yes stop_codon:yes gene_type:complete
MAKTIKRKSMYGVEEIIFSNGTLVTKFGNKYIILNSNGTLIESYTKKKDALDRVKSIYKNLK